MTAETYPLLPPDLAAECVALDRETRELIRSKNVTLPQLIDCAEKNQRLFTKLMQYTVTWHAPRRTNA